MCGRKTSPQPTTQGTVQVGELKHSNSLPALGSAMTISISGSRGSYRAGDEGELAAIILSVSIRYLPLMCSCHIVF